jgi:hypothetical protein
MAVSATPPQDRKPALWRRRWFIITAAILLLLFIVGLTGDPEQSSDEPQGKATPTVTSTAAPDPAQEARAQAAEYVGQGRYFAAVAVLEDADLADAANRVRRRGAHALYRQARRALRDGRYKRARRVAVAARRLRRTAAITALIGTANAGLARERAEAIERRRLASHATSAPAPAARRPRSRLALACQRGARPTPPGCRLDASRRHWSNNSSRRKRRRRARLAIARACRRTHPTSTALTPAARSASAAQTRTGSMPTTTAWHAAVISSVA